MQNYQKIFSALITPMHEDESVNYEALEKVVIHQLKNGVEGFYCCGSSGEALLLTLEERKEIVKRVLKIVDGQVPVVSHVGTIRTKDVIELATHAKQQGVCAVSMIPPYYYKFTHQEIISYYEAVLNQVDVPVIIYNIPQFTGISFDKNNAGILLSNPGIIGVKHTSNDLYGLERMKSAFGDKVYFNGFDELYLSGLAAGATATIGTTVNLFAPIFKRIQLAFLLGDMAIAQEEQKKINRAIETLVSYGIFSGVKYAFTLQGIDCGACRAPFAPLSEEGKKEIAILLEDLL